MNGDGRPRGRDGGARKRGGWSRGAPAGLLSAAVCLALSLAACGDAARSDGSTEGTSDGVVTVGLLMPDTVTGRWETFDRPLIEQRIEELCGDCRIEYANAHGDVGTQQQQVDTMLTEDVDVLIVTPVDSRALRASVEQADTAGVPVVSYDRLATGPVSAYVSFDGEQVGRLQGKALLEAMSTPPNAGPGGTRGEDLVVMMNGDPTDPNARAFEKGARSVLEGEVRIGKAYDTPQWSSLNAHRNMSGAVAALGGQNVDGVYAANDALASGVISALKAEGVQPLPPVTGQDAELAAVQNILEGEQYMTVLKPFEPEAEAAAEMAVALAQGAPVTPLADETVRTSAGAVPAVLLAPVPVTAGNVGETLLTSGMYTIGEICTPKYVSACEKAGLVG